MYLIFKRSARNFEEFRMANRIKIRKVETIEQAREICREFNDNRTPSQIRRGTKAEFTWIGD